MMFQLYARLAAQVVVDVIKDSLERLFTADDVNGLPRWFHDDAFEL